MKDIKSFACSILSELSDRMSKKKSSTKVNKEMKTLESLLKKPVTTDKQNNSIIKPEAQKADRKGVITLKDVERLNPVQELAINKGDIVTPSAKDLLRKRNIKLIVK